MDKAFRQLFIDMTRSTAVMAEQVMDYDKEHDDETGFQNAQHLRDDFEALHDKLEAEDFDGILTKAEYAKLLVSAYIITNNLRDKLANLRKSITAYEETLIPRLQQIVDASEEEAPKMADEILILEDNEQTFDN